MGLGTKHIIADTAARLTGVSDSSTRTATEAVLADLATHFTCDSMFIRHHDVERRCSLLVAQHQAVADDRWDQPWMEPAALSFNDPAVAMARRQSKTAVSPPGRPGVGKRVLDHTLVTVPLLQGSTTIGILGAVNMGDRSWDDEELQDLATVTSLFANLWGRLDAERRLAHHINHDELTGLPNRRKLTAIIDGLTEDRPASLMIVGIDNMKVVNDGLDFEIGNRFLRAMADRLISVVRSDGAVARLAGDQFAVLVLDTAPGQVERMAQRLLEELAVTVELDAELEVARSVSIGVAHNYVAESNQELLTEADAALFQAKRRGKKRAAVFDEEMRANVIDRFETEIELRNALENDEMTLHYQPKIDLHTGEVRGVEALVRWNHPRRGVLAAGAFIETAEDSGLIVDIGDQVLDLAVAQLAQWLPDHPDLEMWINVSPAQLMSRDIAAQMTTLIDRYNTPPERICLEVTEHVMLGDLDSSTGVLRRIRDMGVKLALDDFGTGYSSMKQLKQLPITALKIDRAFVSGLGVNEHDSAIVDAAINLARAFNLGTVAEGVEEQRQVAELRRRGCRIAQGYLFAKPAPAEVVSAMLGTRLAVDEPADAEHR